MLTKHRLVVSAFCALALALSFNSGWAVSNSTCDPADCAIVCDPSDCPPECVVICDPSDCPAECKAICPMECAVVGGGASISFFDAVGTSPFRLFAGQSAEIMK